MKEPNPEILEELRKHEWVVSWSGGKDSTATIILMHKYNIPIKDIYYVRMMYDDNLAATTPEMTQFVDKCVKILTEWGYKVHVIKSEKTAMDLANAVCLKSKIESRNNKKYGIRYFCRRACQFQSVKQDTIEHKIKVKDEYQMIGYAADEIERLHRLDDRRRSMLQICNIKEVDTFNICLNAGMLAPIYIDGYGRDGCFFCPNCSNREIKIFKKQHPELVDKIYNMIEMAEQDLSSLSAVNNWIKDYYSTKGVI